MQSIFILLILVWNATRNRMITSEIPSVCLSFLSCILESVDIPSSCNSNQYIQLSKGLQATQASKPRHFYISSINIDLRFSVLPHLKQYMVWKLCIKYMFFIMSIMLDVIKRIHYIFTSQFVVLKENADRIWSPNVSQNWHVWKIVHESVYKK